MTKKRNVFIAVIVTFLITISLVYVFISLSGIRSLVFPSKDMDVSNNVESAAKIIDSMFYKEVESEKLTTAAIDGMVEALDDRYSEYYDAQDWKIFQDEQRGEYTGIGVQVNYDEENKGVLINKVFEGSGAHDAGINIGDIVIGADGESFEDYTYEEIVSTIRGEVDTIVNIEVKRGDEILFFDITRKVVISDQGEYEMLDNDIGLLTLYSFSGNSEEVFFEAFDFFEQNECKKIIVDLRNNPGGDLRIVTSMLDALLPEGKLINIKDKQGNEEYISSDEDFIDCELVVLTNGNSASASELFSVAIQDYNKGVIVGETTFGKGLVQSIIPMDGGTGIRLTTAEYFSPNGRSINGTGVYPDHYIADEDIMDDDDPQLDFTIELLNE